MFSLFELIVTSSELWQEKKPEKYDKWNRDTAICMVLTIVCCCISVALPMLIIPRWIGNYDGEIAIKDTIAMIFLFDISTIIIALIVQTPFYFASNLCGGNRNVWKNCRWGHDHINTMRDDRVFSFWSRIAIVAGVASYLVSFWILYIIYAH